MSTHCARFQFDLTLVTVKPRDATLHVFGAGESDANFIAWAHFRARTIIEGRRDVIERAAEALLERVH